MSRRCALLLCLPLCGTLAAGACSTTPTIDWQPVQYVAAPAIPISVTPSAMLPAGACGGSLRTASFGGSMYGAWWAVRPDSSSRLVVGRSTDGGRSWSTIVAADTTDASRRGCARPAPAVAVDSATNYFDVAYYLEAATGAGVFFTHTMDATHLGTNNAVFHTPVAVMYGERPARVAVATVRDDVTVAYEDPNSQRPAVGVAVSRVMGHLFQERAIASLPDLPAVDPRVQLDGRDVVVQWLERADTVASGGRIAVRRGRWSQ